MSTRPTDDRGEAGEKASVRTQAMLAEVERLDAEIELVRLRPGRIVRELILFVLLAVAALAAADGARPFVAVIAGVSLGSMIVSGGVSVHRARVLERQRERVLTAEWPVLKP